MATIPTGMASVTDSDAATRACEYLAKETDSHWLCGLAKKAVAHHIRMNTSKAMFAASG
jgi:hypothetical protein